MAKTHRRNRCRRICRQQSRKGSPQQRLFGRRHRQSLRRNARQCRQARRVPSCRHPRARHLPALRRHARSLPPCRKNISGRLPQETARSRQATMSPARSTFSKRSARPRSQDHLCRHLGRVRRHPQLPTKEDKSNLLVFTRQANTAALLFAKVIVNSMVSTSSWYGISTYTVLRRIGGGSFRP